MRIVAVVAGLIAGPAVAAEPIRAVPFTDVQVESGFWSPRLETNRTVTVWYDFRKCEETGRIANFARAGGLEAGPFQGLAFNDSDVFKVIEGAAAALAGADDPKLAAYLDGLIAKIAAAQEPDGYLYTARTLGVNNERTGPERWSHLRHSHELYNVGHLYEAAVAHWRATGQRALLEVAIRSADLVCRVFGPGPEQRRDPPGHQEIELGLIRLHEATGNAAYLEQARFFLEQRGRAEGRALYGPYSQDHEPVSAQRAAVGHAVRAGYMYAAMAELAALQDDAAYRTAVDAIWSDIVTRKMHVTGGIGATARGEAFGAAYELPNASAYLETCAAIAHALFNQRMFLLHGDARYVDVLERVLYNGFLSGVSLAGDRFFYPNPLACDGRKFNYGHCGRAPWFDCSCCPVNVVRFMPAIPGLVYAVRGADVYVNLFIAGRAQFETAAGPLELVQRSRYPWEGRVELEVRPAAARRFALRVRIPGWVQGRPVPGDLYRYADPTPAPWELRVNDEPVTVDPDQGYAVLDRTWRPGDRVVLEMAMPVRRVLAHENVEADRGRVALERGPVVYCVEGVDHDGRALNLVLPDAATFATAYDDDLPGGVTVITAPGLSAERGADNAVVARPVELTAIPYYAWAHREPVGEMAVWLPRTSDVARPRPAETLASRSRPSASHTYHSDSLAALNDQLEPRSSDDHDIPRHTWWPRRGSVEWVQYDLAEPAEVTSVSVYWFDDTGRGQCRVPAEWRVLYRDEAGAWRPVAAGGAYGTEPDRWHEAGFELVTTRAVRIEARLKEGYSGGILEWKVE